VLFGKGRDPDGERKSADEDDSGADEQCLGGGASAGLGGRRGTQVWVRRRLDIPRVLVVAPTWVLLVGVVLRLVFAVVAVSRCDRPNIVAPGRCRGRRTSLPWWVSSCHGLSLDDAGLAITPSLLRAITCRVVAEPRHHARGPTGAIGSAHLAIHDLEDS
jgi:hypothetical protein